MEDNPWVDEIDEVSIDESGTAEGPGEPEELQAAEEEPEAPEAPNESLVYGICIVDFHHIRGPEIEYWVDGSSKGPERIQQINKMWPSLPFQSLPDGAHLFEESFANFTLILNESAGDSFELPPEKRSEWEDSQQGTTLFGCACIRQLAVSELKSVEKDMTRSIVQKAIVLVTRYPATVQLREKLSIVTTSFFQQRDFHDREIIDSLFENLNLLYSPFKVEYDDLYESERIHKKRQSVKVLKESDFYVGLNLRSLLKTLGKDLLVLYKAMLLEKRVVFFSKNLMKLSSFQYSLLSLVPSLILNLQDSGSPLFQSLTNASKRTTSLSLSDRRSVLEFLGLPLKIFDRGGFFQPYLALQQLDFLRNPNTEWYVIGISNDLILGQKEQLADIVVHIDSPTSYVEIIDASLKDKLSLTAPDKKFMSFLVSECDKVDDMEKQNTVLNDSMLNLNTFKGGEDFIRYNFEDYLIGLMSSCKYDQFLARASDTQLQSFVNAKQELVMPNHIGQFNQAWVEAWRQTRNFQFFNIYTDDESFNFFEPVHQADRIDYTKTSYFGNFKAMGDFFNRKVGDLKKRAEERREEREELKTKTTREEVKAKTSTEDTPSAYSRINAWAQSWTNKGT